MERVRKVVSNIGKFEETVFFVAQYAMGMNFKMPPEASIIISKIVFPQDPHFLNWHYAGLMGVQQYPL